MKDRTERDKVYKKAQELWGVDSQITISIEEISELITELGKLITLLAKRNRVLNKSNDEDVVNEIADVWIMLEHLSLIYGKDKVMERIEYKVGRLESWIDNDEKVW